MREGFFAGDGNGDGRVLSIVFKGLGFPASSIFFTRETFQAVAQHRFAFIDIAADGCGVCLVMFRKRYLGLTGSSLNIAISVIAGIDFFLFGYDQGVMGGLLTLGSFVKTFPEIDVGGAAPEDRSHVSTIQGIAVASYNVGKMESPCLPSMTDKNSI